MKHRKVFIVGAAGMVGANTANALAMQAVVSEIVLIDVAANVAAGQAMDIDHATGYSDGVQVRLGDYSEISADDIIVITAGVPRLANQTRTELLEVNARIIKTIVSNIMAQGHPVFILVVANPVDMLTQVALEASGLPKERVFGTGTMLDTARLRATLARQLHVLPKHVHGYILGEHGNTSFPATSALTIGGIPLKHFPGFQPQMAETLTQEIRSASQKIIEAKKSTHFGISQVVVKIVQALLRPSGSILPVCSMTSGEYGLSGVVIGLPTLISTQGAIILDKYLLNEAETAQLRHSAGTIQDAMDQYATRNSSVATKIASLK